MTIVPGTHIGNAYEVVEPIAQGGMGELVRAVRKSDGSPVVLKVLRPSLRGLPEAVERFHREADMVARIHSRHVVDVLGVAEDTKLGPVIVFEYLQGESLDQLLKRRNILPLGEVFPMARQVFTGLMACHESGVVHRDLKPGNIFLIPSALNTPPLVKLIDFGTGKLQHSTGETTVLTKVGQNLGTFAYMAPEQSLEPSAVDCRADLYASGVLIFRLLTGKLPYHATNLPQMIQMKQTSEARTMQDALADSNIQIPENISYFVARLLKRSPDERPRTAQEARSVWQSLALSFKEGED